MVCRKLSASSPISSLEWQSTLMSRSPAAIFFAAALRPLIGLVILFTKMNAITVTATATMTTAPRIMMISMLVCADSSEPVAVEMSVIPLLRVL